jgi:hypothetical protein
MFGSDGWNGHEKSVKSEKKTVERFFKRELGSDVWKKSVDLELWENKQGRWRVSSG